MAVSEFLMCNKFLRKHDIYSGEHTERYFSYKSCTFESTGNSSFGPVLLSSVQSRVDLNNHSVYY